MCSLFRNDVGRGLDERVGHLLSKWADYPDVRYIWVVGDSTDGTLDALWGWQYEHRRIVDITVLWHDTGIVGEEGRARFARIGATANVWLEHLRVPSAAPSRGALGDEDDYVLIHESDLRSPGDVVTRLVEHAEAGRCPVAGWPVLDLDGGRIFYDSWAYRGLDGQHFSNHAPYHPSYVADRPFEVASVGSCWLMRAEDARCIRFGAQTPVDGCRQLRELGRRIWVDPSLIVSQPRELWVPHTF